MNARVLVLWFGLGLVFMLAVAPAQGELQVGIGRRVITPDPLLPISGGLGPTAPVYAARRERPNNQAWPPFDLRAPCVTL